MKKPDNASEKENAKRKKERKKKRRNAEVERQKKERKKKRRNAEVELALPFSSSKENLCQGCGKDYEKGTTDDQQWWIGCDIADCRRWYHY